jgi:triosephosphate isomerase
MLRLSFILLSAAGLVGVCDAADGAMPLSRAGAPMRLKGGDRKYFIAGNWKLNPTTLDEAKDLATKVVKAASNSKRDMDTCVCCPYPFLGAVSEILKGSKVSLGAEDCFTEAKGAYTGGVSTGMLKSVGVKYVLCGHSERRQGNIATESDETINLKVRKVLDEGLYPILCVGETKDEYEANLNKAVCALQLSKGLKGVSKEEMKKITIAYEPVWAIGTGLTATPEIAQNVHAYIREWIAQMYDQATADGVQIQYGGSVTPESVDQLMACPDIDGALVGGASLIAEKFDKIINFK